MKRMKLLLIILITAAISAIVAVSLDNYLGIRLGTRVVLPVEEAQQYNAMRNKYSKLEYIMDMVETRFYDETNEAALLEGAYKGILDSIDDPYSVYYTSEDYEFIKEINTSSYGGIGVVVTPGDDGKILVISPIEDTPGERKGILPGDKIISVDEIMVFANEIDNAVSRIKGQPGETVILGIEREGFEKLISVEIEREKIVIKVAKSEIIEDDIGYLRLTMFDSKSYTEFKENLDSLKSQGIKGLIIDLRNNPGGDVDECVKIADELLGEQTIVEIDYGDGEVDIETSDEAVKLDIPFVVLANENSASSSEILIGAVQDTESGIIIGETTFGKGVVQVLEPLADGSAVKLTIANYKTPEGRNIHKIGIKPDITVHLPEEISYDSDGNAIDVQLEKALEVIREEIK
ncbi:MAG: S41 family peptidase [Peptostreptococcaceae bacterium]|nr:S41 family peptidase [Peptostreptococcaceae bacterium]